MTEMKLIMGAEEARKWAGDGSAVRRVRATIGAGPFEGGVTYYPDAAYYGVRLELLPDDEGDE